MSATDLTGPCTSGQSFLCQHSLLFICVVWLSVDWMTPSVCVCLRRRRGRLIGAVTEQMVPVRHWTSDRGKINAHNFKTKKKLINMEEHKIALHQCRILINRCFVCGLLVFFSPLLFSNGDNLCFFRAEGRLWRFQIKLVCFFSLFLTRSPPFRQNTPPLSAPHLLFWSFSS